MKASLHLINPAPCIFEPNNNIKEGNKNKALKAETELKDKLSNEEAVSEQSSTSKKNHFSFLGKFIKKNKKNKKNKIQYLKKPIEPSVTRQDMDDKDLYKIESWKAIFKK